MRSKYVIGLVLFSLALYPNISNALLLKEIIKSFANVGLKLEIWAQNNGKVYTNDQNSTNFSVEQARIYFAGQINKVVQFGANLDFADNNVFNPGADGSARTHQGVPYTMVRDAFINLHFKKSFNVMTGLFLDPWSRYELEYTWSFIIPTENFLPEVGTINYDILNGKLGGKPFITPLASFNIGGDFQSALRDAGIVFWGSTPDTMLKYYLFAGNGKYDYQLGHNGKGNLKYGFRAEFTPTFLGFKGEPAYIDQETAFYRLYTCFKNFILN